MTEPVRRKASGNVDPTAEENFPDNPTRRAADREMNEPANLRPSARPLPRREPPARELDEDGG
ncbi:MAG TPA: hypothetical protein VFH78_09065 [Candidatus Thermoplasmatota archaeon]|nr:hypothetical protein [Candidatus Thermoplasmatota archaeon]